MFKERIIIKDFIKYKVLSEVKSENMIFGLFTE